MDGGLVERQFGVVNENHQFAIEALGFRLRRPLAPSFDGRSSSSLREGRQLDREGIATGAKVGGEGLVS